MENFYIFLDVDGVLNNYAWVKFLHKKNAKNTSFDEHLCPYNVKVLNKILSKISQQKLKPIIVISSSWRKFQMEKLITLLQENKLEYSGEYFKTASADEFQSGNVRGLEIKNFLYSNDIESNFMVIDDEMADITPYIEKEHLLKASGLFELGLSRKNAQDFFKINFPLILNKIEKTKANSL